MWCGWRYFHLAHVNKNYLATGMGNGRNGGVGYTCWSPRLLLLSPRHSDRHFPRCFSCRNYKEIKSVSFEKSSRFSGEGVLISELKMTRIIFSHWLGFFRLNSWIGSSDDKLKNYERIRPAPDTFMSIKDHLPSSLSWQDKKQKQEGRHLETQVFSSLPRKKIPLISSAVWRGTIVCCAFYAHQN